MNNSTTILKGEVVEAVYQKQKVAEYNGNPFIESLPPLMEPIEVAKKIRNIPEISDEDKSQSTGVRSHMIQRISEFVEPMTNHLKIESKLGTIIRKGYLARNPMEISFLERIRILNNISNDLLKKESSEENYVKKFEGLRSTADAFPVIGVSGMGKTTAVEKLLLMYPQVIIHSKYKDKSVNLTQIVWLKIDCPYDGSLNTLCKNFFKAVDDILGTRYFEKNVYSTRSVSLLLQQMSIVASLHGVGVLCIDEIQHLVNNKENDTMLNFFVTLANTVGIPLVLIGTPQAEQLFGNLRQARRGSSMGTVKWSNMEEDSREWKMFLEDLWKLQYLKNYTQLNAKLSHAFYDECQGITAIAVNLFRLIQTNALLQNMEEITVSLIRQTAKDELYLVQPKIEALRSRDFKKIIQYDDISLDYRDVTSKIDLILIDTIQKRYQYDIDQLEDEKCNICDRVTLELTKLDIFEMVAQIEIKEIARKEVQTNPKSTYEELMRSTLINLMKINDDRKNKRTIEKVASKERLIKNAEKELLEIYERGIKEKKDLCEILENRGFIKNPLKEFPF